jgi:hypothetical protein
MSDGVYKQGCFMAKNEIPRGTEIKIKDKSGKIHNYCAVRKRSNICPICYPADGTPGTACKGSKKCFAEECRTCGFFGHYQWGCLQAYTIHGDKLDPNEK